MTTIGIKNRNAIFLSYRDSYGEDLHARAEPWASSLGEDHLLVYLALAINWGGSTIWPDNCAIKWGRLQKELQRQVEVASNESN